MSVSKLLIFCYLCICGQHRSIVPKTSTECSEKGLVWLSNGAVLTLEWFMPQVLWSAIHWLKPLLALVLVILKCPWPYPEKYLPWVNTISFNITVKSENVMKQIVDTESMTFTYYSQKILLQRVHVLINYVSFTLSFPYTPQNIHIHLSSLFSMTLTVDKVNIYHNS